MVREGTSACTCVPSWLLRHQHHPHSVGVTGPGTPAGHNQGHITRLEEVAVLSCRAMAKTNRLLFNNNNTPRPPPDRRGGGGSSPGGETLLLTDLQGEIHAHVDVLCPDIVGSFGVEDGVDAAVEVRLAGGLSTAGHSDDGCSRPVPGQHVGRPAKQPG